MHLPAFPVMTLFMIFIIWTAVKLKATEQEEKKKSDAFWEREYAANQVRKQDISGLDYIRLQPERLPFRFISVEADSSPVSELTLDQTPDSEKLAEFEKNILALADQPMLNLSGQSNTDLKLQYGAANLDFLSRCDQNYVTLIKTLYEWGSELYRCNKTDDALLVLEEGVRYHTDIRGHYTLLASIYQELGKDFMVEKLIDSVKQSDSPRKESILEALKRL